jgi:hypothetical protein
MPPFDVDADLSDDHGYHLAENGPVSLFWRHSLFDETVRWLATHGYQVVRMDAASWPTEAEFHRAIASALGFPGYYGSNLNAFNDCLGDVAGYRYGSLRDAAGTVLAFSGYDAFAARQPTCAQSILDVVAVQSRFAMLFGHRMLCLVQSNDPDIEFDVVGASPVSWNQVEWMRTARGVGGSTIAT